MPYTGNVRGEASQLITENLLRQAGVRRRKRQEQGGLDANRLQLNTGGVHEPNRTASLKMLCLRSPCGQNVLLRRSYSRGNDQKLQSWSP